MYNKTVNINGIEGQETLRHCGNMNDDKIENYKFIVGNTVVIVGLKGKGSTFDDNLAIFTKSINTLTLSPVAQKSNRD